LGQIERFPQRPGNYLHETENILDETPPPFFPAPAFHGTPAFPVPRPASGPFVEFTPQTPAKTGPSARSQAWQTFCPAITIF